MSKIWRSPAISFCKDVLKLNIVEDERPIIEKIKKWKVILRKLPKTVHGTAARILDFESRCLVAIGASSKLSEFIELVNKSGVEVNSNNIYSAYYNHIVVILRKYD